MKSLKKKNKKTPSCLGKGRMLWFLVQHSVSILLHPSSNSINVFNISGTKKGGTLVTTVLDRGRRLAC